MDRLLTHLPALMPTLEAFGLRLLGVVLALAAGVVLIRFVVRLTEAALARTRIGPTLAGFVASGLRAILAVLLVVVVLGLCGLEVASFAALLAGVGIAIGGALSGLLGDFAAGLLLLVLRPFDVGDDVAVEGAAGEVSEIGVFRTVLTRDDNVRITVGNNRLLEGVIERRRGKAVVRVRRRLTVARDADTGAIAATLAPQLAAITDVLATPASRVGVVDFGTGYPAIEIRAYCDAANEDAVQFAINRLAAQLPRSLGEPVRVRITIATR